eukprot:93558_1
MDQILNEDSFHDSFISTPNSGTSTELITTNDNETEEENKTIHGSQSDTNTPGGPGTLMTAANESNSKKNLKNNKKAHSIENKTAKSNENTNSNENNTANKSNEKEKAKFVSVNNPKLAQATPLPISPQKRPIFTSKKKGRKNPKQRSNEWKQKQQQQQKTASKDNKNQNFNDFTERRKSRINNVIGGKITVEIDKGYHSCASAANEDEDDEEIILQKYQKLPKNMYTNDEEKLAKKLEIYKFKLVNKVNHIRQKCQVVDKDNKGSVAGDNLNTILEEEKLNTIKNIVNEEHIQSLINMHKIDKKNVNYNTFWNAAIDFEQTDTQSNAKLWDTFRFNLIDEKRPTLVPDKSVLNYLIQSMRQDNNNNERQSTYHANSQTVNWQTTTNIKKSIEKQYGKKIADQLEYFQYILNLNADEKFKYNESGNWEQDRKACKEKLAEDGESTWYCTNCQYVNHPVTMIFLIYSL